MKLPKSGIVLVSGNTMDLYGKGMKGLLATIHTSLGPKPPILHLSPDRGLMIARASSEVQETMEAEVKRRCVGLLEPPSPLSLFDALLRTTPGCVGIVDFAEGILAAPRGWGDHAKADANVVMALRWVDELVDHLVVIISRDNLEAIHPALRQARLGLTHIVLPLPNEGERIGLVGNEGTKATGLTVRQLVTCGAEWQMAQAESIRLISEGTMTSRWCNTQWDWIGGHEAVKKLLRDEILPAYKRRDRYSPLGILLVGAPGTGKSIMGEIIATHLGEALHEQVGGPITSSFVGENERRMKETIAAIRHTGGVWYMDEGDKQFSGLDGWQGDSGIQMRQQMQLHTFMADPTIRGHILFLMCVNRPFSLPASMTRAGRFDIVLPFLAPGKPEDRLHILQALAKRHGLDAVPTPVWEAVAQPTRFWTGADLEACMLTMARRDVFTVAFAKELVDNLRPAIDPDKLVAMDEETKAFTRDKRLLA